MDVVRIFPDRFAQVFWQVHINDNMMMAFAVVNPLLGWLNFNPFRGHAYFYRAGNHGTIGRIGDRYGITCESTGYSDDKKGNKQRNQLCVNAFHFFLNSLLSDWLYYCFKTCGQFPAAKYQAYIKWNAIGSGKKSTPVSFLRFYVDPSFSKVETWTRLVNQFSTAQLIFRAVLIRLKKSEKVSEKKYPYRYCWFLPYFS